jgi:hypothetical protein
VSGPFRVAEISNVDWSEQPPKAKSRFTIKVHTVKKPFHLISGYRHSVSMQQQFQLHALARNVVRPAAHILDELADINAKAAEHGNGYISKDCWTTFQVADGDSRRTASRNIGQHPGSLPMILGGIDMSEFVRNNFRPNPGAEMRLVQSAGFVLGAGVACR